MSGLWRGWYDWSSDGSLSLDGGITLSAEKVEMASDHKVRPLFTPMLRPIRQKKRDTYSSSTVSHCASSGGITTCVARSIFISSFWPAEAISSLLPSPMADGGVGSTVGGGIGQPSLLER